MVPALVLYLIGVNVVTVAAFAADKRAAQARARRISERRLLMLAAIGGSPGALAAQQLLRHKTRKAPFRTRLWAVAGVQAVLLAAAAYRLLR